MHRNLLIALVGAIALLVPSLASAQPGGGRFGGGFGGGGDLMLLSDENVQKDLEILDSQKEKLDELRNRIRDEMRELFQGGGDREGLREKMQEKMTSFQKEMEEVLLPHQRDRLKQIGVQSRMRFGSPADSIGNALELTDEEKEKLREKDRELSQEMNKEIAKIREKYRDKLLENLSPEQRAKFKELVGKPIEFAPAQFGQGGPGGRGRGQGGRGGRGGDNSN